MILVQMSLKNLIIPAQTRHKISLTGFLEYLCRLALVDKLDLRLEKERVVVKGRRHGNIVAANFYQLDYIDKLERFLKVYVVGFVSKRTSENEQNLYT